MNAKTEFLVRLDSIMIMMEQLICEHEVAKADPKTHEMIQESHSVLVEVQHRVLFEKT